MIKYKVVILSAIAAGVVLGGSVTGYLYNQGAKSVIPTVRSDGKSVALGNANALAPGDENATNNAATNTTNLPNSADSSSQSGASDPSLHAVGSSTPASKSSLPGPAGFGVYDQYKNNIDKDGNPSALYIDTSAAPKDAPVVKVGSAVTVQYKGWLTSGKEFDESYVRGKPFTFVEGQHQVISGWEEGLFGMAAGATRRLIIPPALGYGDTVQDQIPAGSVLIFDVELLSVQ